MNNLDKLKTEVEAAEIAYHVAVEDIKVVSGTYNEAKEMAMRAQHKFHVSNSGSESDVNIALFALSNATVIKDKAISTLEMAKINLESARKKYEEETINLEI